MEDPAEQFRRAFDVELAGDRKEAEKLLDAGLQDLIASHACDWVDVFAMSLVRLRRLIGDAMGAREAVRAASCACPNALGAAHLLASLEIELGCAPEAESALKRFEHLTTASTSEFAGPYRDFIPILVAEFTSAFGRSPEVNPN